MKVDIIDTRVAQTFGALALAEIFTTDTGGLYIKVEDNRAFILGSKPQGGVPAGRFTPWGIDGKVIPAKSVQVTL